MKQKLLSILLLCTLLVGTAFAQSRTITGKVTSEDGLALPGVSVMLSGTAIAAQTNVNGIYSIEVPTGSQSLNFRYLGFTPKTQALGSSNTLNVILLEGSSELDDVVVVAYGTATKESITGSVASIGSAEIDKRVVTNLSNIIAGISPGVSATSGNGQPGTGSAIRIRGFGSISASNSPLYVVDGSVFDGDIGDINANDVESVSLLKDASSTALYGSRGGNGVIIITTKKGKREGAQLSVNLNQGFSERGTPEYDRLDAFEYYPAMWEAVRNSLVYPATGTGLSYSDANAKATDEIQTRLVYNPFNVGNKEIVGLDGKINPNASLLYNDFDWYAPLQRTGVRTDAGMSVAGKSDKSDYFVSLGYLDDKGYIKKSDFERFSGRVNVNSTIKSWLKTGVNVSGSISEGTLASDAATGNGSSYINPFMFARRIGPIYPVRAYDAAGEPVMNDVTGQQWYDYGMHPGAINRPQGAQAGRHVVYETLLNDVLNRRNLLSARAFTEIKFLKDFTFKPTLSLDVRENHSTTYRNKNIGDGATLNGYSYKSASTIKSYTFNQILTYDKQIDKHKINILAGHENYDYDYRSLTASKTGIILEGNTEFPNFVTPYSAGGYMDSYRIESYLSRVSYDYDSKYFVDASLRRDGSSRFHKDARWGTFFSVGASWAISKESFMDDISWVNDLRLKASYGEVGNDATLDGDGNSTYYNYQSFYDLGWNNGSEPGLLLQSAGNPLLKWEASKTFNTGLAFSLFNNRLTGELEYFKRGSSNLIFSVPLALSNPVTSILQNIGSMYNTGFDLQIGGDVVRKDNFTWNMMTNWSTFKNEITKMPEETPVITTGTKRREVGRDIYSFWLRQYGGVDPTDGSALYIPDENSKPADKRTIDGVDYTVDYNTAKFDYSGTAIPDLIGSVTNSFRYKDFGLSFLINYQIGGKFYDSNYQDLMSVSYGSSLHKDVLNSWNEPGQVTDIPRLDVNRTSFNNGTSNRWLVDASYLSFRNVNLSYNLPASLVNRVDVSNVRVFASGENLGLLSKRKGMNPTESFDGLNNTRYLPSRVFSFGINVSL